MSRGIAILFLGPRHSRWGWGLAPRPGRLYPRERPGTHFTGGCVGPRAGLDRCGKSRPHRDSIPNRPAHSQSLYRLSYRAHTPNFVWSRYRSGVAQRMGRGIALLFRDRGTRRGWVVSSKPRPHFTPGKDPVPILLEAGWVPGPVWTDGKSRPHRDSIPDCPARSQSLYRLSYRANNLFKYTQKMKNEMQKWR